MVAAERAPPIAHSVAADPANVLCCCNAREDWRNP